EMAASLASGIGRRVRYVDVDPATYRTWEFAGANELGNMLQFKRDFEEVFCATRSLEKSKQLNPSLQTFDQWLARHAGEFRVSRELAPSALFSADRWARQICRLA